MCTERNGVKQDCGSCGCGSSKKSGNHNYGSPETITVAGSGETITVQKCPCGANRRV